jgi:hypothetical protein
MKYSDQVEEAQLLARAQTGDVEAFGDLYAPYLDVIYYYVFYRVKHRGE